MKKLNDYCEEIHKCSKCGLCQSVCPVYKVTGNDCSVSRGKFIMLNGIVKGDLKLNKNVNKYLDMCLKCNACKDFCPSDIDARKIFLTAKAEYFSNGCPNAKFLKVLHSPFVFNLFLNCAKIATNTYRFLRLDKFTKLFYPILSKFELGKKTILANEFVSGTIYNNKHSCHCEEGQSPDAAIQEKNVLDCFANARNDIKHKIKIVYFEGCVNNYINPKTKNIVKNILTSMNVEIIPAKFKCCGVPFLSGGNVEQFIKQAEFNLAQIPDDFDYLLTDCASCQNAFFEYENYINDEKLLEKLKKINEKSINVVDFIVKNAKSFEFDKKTSFTFHKPCHLEDLSFLQEFLAKAKNVEYIEMKDFDKCCGFSGEFAIKNPEISQQISTEKAQNSLNTKADYILTSCPSCILGLKQGEINLSTFQPFNLSTFIEFLSNAKITI